MKSIFMTIEVGGMSYNFDSYHEMINYYKNYPYGSWDYIIKHPLKCLSPECRKTVLSGWNSQSLHLRKNHPKFYALIIDSKKQGEKVDYDKFFEVDRK